MTNETTAIRLIRGNLQRTGLTSKRSLSEVMTDQQKTAAGSTEATLFRQFHAFKSDFANALEPLAFGAMQQFNYPLTISVS